MSPHPSQTLVAAVAPAAPSEQALALYPWASPGWAFLPGACLWGLAQG